MKTIKLLLAVLLLILSSSFIVSAAESMNSSIEGIHTKNNPAKTQNYGYTAEINKTIETIKADQYIDVKLTLKSTNNNEALQSPGTPKTGDSIWWPIPFFLLLGVGLVILLWRLSKKRILSIFLVIALFLVNLPITTAKAEIKNLAFDITERFTDDILDTFTYQKIISTSSGDTEMIKNDHGLTTGIRWTLSHAEIKQQLVYRLSLKENIPDNLLEKEIQISSARMDLTLSDGKNISMDYPNVSVKLKAHSEPLPPPAFSFIKTSHTTQLPLAGAVFELWQGTNLITTATSDAEGLVSFGILAPGTFELIETQAPVNYVNNPETYEVVVSGSGDITVNGLPYQSFSIDNWQVSAPPTVDLLLWDDVNVSGKGIFSPPPMGTTIIVTYADGSKVTSSVWASGMWVAIVPAHVWPLVIGQKVSVVQIEPRKLPSEPVTTVIQE